MRQQEVVSIMLVKAIKAMAFLRQVVYIEGLRILISIGQKGVQSKAVAILPRTTSRYMLKLTSLDDKYLYIPIAMPYTLPTHAGRKSERLQRDIRMGLIPKPQVGGEEQ